MRKNLSGLLFALLLSAVLHLGLFLLWVSYEGLTHLKPKDKNPEIIEVHLEEPTTKSNSDLNARLNNDKQSSA